MHVNIRDGLLELPGAWMKVQGRRTLKPELAKYLDVFTRADLTGWTEVDCKQWWAGLLAAAAQLGVPTARLLEQQTFHTPRILDAIALLESHPHLPASNAAVETAARLRLRPFLTGRAHLMRNLARTNFLFDLVVAREYGAFGDLDRVTKLLKDHNEAAGGWAPAPRLLADTQPLPHPDGTPAARYSSLLNPLLVPVLARQYLTSAGGESDEADR